MEDENEELRFYEMIEGFPKKFRIDELDYQIIKQHNEELLKKLHLAKGSKEFNEEDAEEIIDIVEINKRTKENKSLQEILDKMEKIAVRLKQGYSKKKEQK